MPEQLKKRISASIDNKIIAQIESVSKVDKRSFSSMVEILLSEALKARGKK